MAKIYYDPSRLSDDQKAQLEALRSVCEISREDELMLSSEEVVSSFMKSRNGSDLGGKSI